MLQHTSSEVNGYMLRDQWRYFFTCSIFGNDSKGTFSLVGEVEEEPDAIPKLQSCFWMKWRCDHRSCDSNHNCESHLWWPHLHFRHLYVRTSHNTDIKLHLFTPIEQIHLPRQSLNQLPMSKLFIERNNLQISDEIFKSCPDCYQERNKSLLISI